MPGELLRRALSRGAKSFGSQIQVVTTSLIRQIRYITYSHFGT